MNNETIKRFDITIKLRGDHVYDLYINGKWFVSCGSLYNILNKIQGEIKSFFLN